METISELREMGDDQLRAVLKEACTRLFKLRIQAQTDRVDAPSELKRNRRLIARIKTIQSERRLADAATAATAEAGA